MPPHKKNASRRILIDTNIVIYLEDYSQNGANQGRQASMMHRLASELGYHFAVSSSTIEELKKSGTLADLRLKQIEKYPELTADNPEKYATLAGYCPPLKENDKVDLELISIMLDNQASWLITEDQALIQHATQAKLNNVRDLTSFIEILQLTESNYVPYGADEVKPDTIDITNSIFDSLRDDYSDFDIWWNDKVLAEERPTIIIGEPTDPKGLVVIKENDNGYNLPTGTAKICTFKIDEEHQGKHYGEFLFKATVMKLRSLTITTCFIEVADKQTRLIDLLTKFGFIKMSGVQSRSGDMVYVKRLYPPAKSTQLSPWEFQKQYGPGILKLDRAFFVPIQEHWHEKLFMNRDDKLFHIPEPCGNAITKVYMCNSPSNKVKQGDALLFVVSGTSQTIFNIGVVEEVFRSDDPLDIIGTCATRTVYSPEQINNLCNHKNGVLVIKFRHALELKDPWTWAEEDYISLFRSGIPQSITEVTTEGVKWLKKALNA